MVDFLVTTSCSVTLYKDGNLKDLKVVKGARRIYGLTWDEKERAFVVIKYPNRKDDVIETFEAPSFKFRQINVKRKLMGVHQILYLNNCLYIVNTDSNEILIRNLKTGKNVIKSWRENSTTVHINSIFYDGNNFYVVEHRNFDSRIIITDDLTFGKHKELRKIGEHVHNVYLEDNLLYCLSSHESSFNIIDLKSNKIKYKHKLKALGDNAWYLRGLARFKNGWIVGHSLREKNRKKRNYVGTAAISILNNNFNVNKEIEIQNRGQIHEIRIINRPDPSHNNIAFHV